MTTYCTKADMLARFDPRTLVQLTDRPANDTIEPATEITDAVLDQARADAGDLIDGYLAVAYPLPLPSTPPALVRVACEVTLAFLYRDSLPDHVAALRKSALAWLGDVRDNKVRLFPSDPPTEGKGDGLVEMTAADRIFTRDSMKGGGL